jgi:glycosyltransferase involved in cell wall biosynthesis
VSTDQALTLVVTAHSPCYLTEALTSVAAQSAEDFDLVCCADSAAPADVLRLFKEYLPYIRCRGAQVLTVTGGTAGRVRNAGFAAARTGWVAYLDGDDVLRPDAVAVMLSAIGDADADILSTGMTRIGQDGKPESWPASESYLPPRWIYRIDPDTVGHPTFFNQFLAIRRDLWTAHPFHEATNGEDIDFMLHQLLSGKFRKLAAPVYGYRDTPGSFSKREYEGGDICTVRYQSGYYRRLFERRYVPALAGNFSDAPEPSC